MLSFVCVSVRVCVRELYRAARRFRFKPIFVCLCLCVYARECDISYVCEFMHVCMHTGVALLSLASHGN